MECTELLLPELSSAAEPPPMIAKDDSTIMRTAESAKTAFMRPTLRVPVALQL